MDQIVMIRGTEYARIAGSDSVFPVVERMGKHAYTVDISKPADPEITRVYNSRVKLTPHERWHY